MLRDRPYFRASCDTVSTSASARRSSGKRECDGAQETEHSADKHRTTPPLWNTGRSCCSTHYYSRRALRETMRRNPCRHPLLLPPVPAQRRQRRELSRFICVQPIIDIFLRFPPSRVFSERQSAYGNVPMYPGATKNQNATFEEEYAMTIPRRSRQYFRVLRPRECNEGAVLSRPT